MNRELALIKPDINAPKYPKLARNVIRVSSVSAESISYIEIKSEDIKWKLE